MTKQQMQILISVRDKASKAVKGISKNLKKLSKVAKASGRGITKAFGGIAKSIFSLKTAVVALAGVYGFVSLTKSILQTGGAFQDYRTTLKTVLGSTEKANVAFAWLNDFAKTTPFAIDNLTASFVKLAAYGIDGTKVMRTLGDTAAAMGKDINMAVEALADAQTGEFERLKEFGIKAIVITKANAKGMKLLQKEVGRTALAFTDKMGKESYKIIDRNNRAMVTSTLLAIWNERYEGAMAERSKTMNGMLNNLGDAWTNFKVLVADRLLPLVEAGLQNVLDKVDEWGNNGVLFGWAQMLGQVMGGAIQWVKGLASAFVSSFEQMGWSFFSFKVDLEAMKVLGKEFGETLIKWFRKIKGWLSTEGEGMWDNIKEGALSFLNIINSISTAISYMSSKMRSLNNFGNTVGNAVGLGFLDGQRVSGSRATGGGVNANQSYLVGERGPERFTPTTSGSISPNSGGETNITNIYTSATSHGINNAMASRSDNVSRGARIGMKVANAFATAGYSNLSMARAR